MTEEIAAMLSACGIPDGSVARWRDDLRLPHVRSAAKLPAAPQSVLVCAFPYYVGRIPGNLSLYAMLPDYHTVVMGMLEQLAALLRERWPENTFVAFSDASPVDEVEAGTRAALGLRGKNGLLLHETWGSFFFLGEIVTDLLLPAAEGCGSCEDCGACRRACPGGALGEEGFHSERCLSGISQKKGTLTAEEEALLRRGGLVWGCDRCQLACPHNKNIPTTPIGAFSGDIEPELNLDNLGRLMKNRAFAWRGRAVLERNLALFSQPQEKGEDSREV
jgi:epoxyqueuosine reductase QueG